MTENRSPWPIVAAFAGGVMFHSWLSNNGDRVQPLLSTSDAVTAYEPVTSADEFTYYVNCSEARAAGAAPVRVGDPGYAPHLDRDRDGVGCE